MSKNVFVVGADAFNCKQLQCLPGAEEFNFHQLLSFDEVKGGGHYPPFDQLLERAEEQLKRFSGSIDAIIGYWDFPVTSMVPLLCAHHGLPAPSVEAEMKCDHKFWSRLEQQAVVPQHTPAFSAIDPFAETPLANTTLDYPFWLKPIKGTDSLLAFKISNRQDFDDAISKIREQIADIARPFNQLLNHVQLPPEVAAIDGYHCIIEELMSGHQCTIEGHVYQGDVRTHGIIDSINYPRRSSFFRYQYPSRLPKGVKQEMMASSQHLMEHIGYDNGGFNIEYFYNPRNENIMILEVNPRISQSHSVMFQMVDGASNHKIALDLALGREPNFPYRQGEYGCAAKFHVRRFENAYVTRVPTEDEIRELEEQITGIKIDMIVREGMMLSDLIEQDSYSYDMAHLHIGARNQKELLTKYRQVLELLPLEFQDSVSECT
ncbi:MAG: ATP-grasp domain-containing protein [Halothece sp. Uz-M2-17]|nr:ATP-grasp domain-containing protein [Halothece sp. Uz-M2-17]